MGRRAKTLRELAAVVSGDVHGDADVVVSDVTHDSRTAAEDMLYVAVPGATVDGHEFIGDAIGHGATAICVSRVVAADVPSLLVTDTRTAMAPLADWVHDSPSHSMSVIGVTGTNGKTTVTHYIESIAEGSGATVGLIGTIETRVAGVGVPASHTTPESTDLQRLLAGMRDTGVSIVATEVSSHALEFGRVASTRFEVAAFTNLSQDHLDFHGDMAAYQAAKTRLFTEHEVGTSVLNTDDPVGAELASSLQGSCVSVGAQGDVRVSDLTSEGGRSAFRFVSPWGSASLSAPVLGSFNVANLAIAATCCLVTGMEFDDVVAGMTEVRGVPGRFEPIRGEVPFMVVVDYAHTPAGITAAIAAARQVSKGRVVALVGAGGDRDRRKRPGMGSAISAADVVVITTDNPRSEDPDSIVDQVVSGVTAHKDPIVEVDRRTAIGSALRSAAESDIVLILGRGHEPHQEVAGELIPFDDRQVSAELIEELSKSAETDSESGSMSR